MIDRSYELPVEHQAKLLKVSRGSVYYLPKPVSEAEPSVAAQFKRVLNLFGLGNFARAIEEESRVHRTLGGRAK
jgi:predicted transcriptional regulator